MSDRLKRVLLIAGFFAAVILIALALYFVFFRPVTVPPEIPPEEPAFPGVFPPTEPGVPPVIEPEEPGVIGPTPGIIIPQEEVPPTGPTLSTRAQGGPVIPQRFVTANADFATLSGNGADLNYYDQSTGLFSRVNAQGQIELLSSRVFRDVESVTWAPTTDRAVLEFPDGSNIIYDFTSEQSYTLPSQYEDFSFSPDSSRVAAKDMKINPEDRWLVSVDSTGKNKQLIEHLGDNPDRVRVQWNPNDQIVATSSRSIDGTRAEVTFLTNNGAQLNRAIVQGSDLRYRYSPNGNRMVYSVFSPTSNYQPTLWITSSNPSAIDAGRINTGLITWADKCSFPSANTIYCAVPTDIDEYSGILPENNDSNDVIYRIDANTGQSQLVAEPLFGAQIGSVSVSSDGQTLYYTDANTGAINKIDL